MRLRSLAARLVLWSVAVQSLLAVIALAATLMFLRQPGDEHAFAHMHVIQLVEAALARDPDGHLRLNATPALAAFRRERPEAQVAVFQGRAALPGSAPGLVAAVAASGRPWFANATFTFTEGAMAGSTVVATAVRGPFGEVVIVAADNPFRLADLPALAVHMGGYLVRVVLVAMMGAALITPFVIARALRPLRAASAAASRIDLRTRGLRLPDSGGVPSELLGLIRSINAALDRLDEGFSRQQRYAAQAAHELRTPLAVLAARIDTLDGHPVAAGLRRDLERMRALVEQLLLVSRLERGDVLLDETLDLVELAREVVADLAPLAFTQDRRLEFIPLCPNRSFRGGRRVLEGALANLIRNAIRAEPAGGTVVVSVGPCLEFTVTDHGDGVAPDDRERIFEPFWRRSEDHAGAGLGLTIVREAAEAHGGAVSLRETEGGGATFRVKLPSVGPAMVSIHAEARRS